MKIRELPDGERPREKMAARGAAALSDGELLAVLLRSGTRRESVLDVSRRLLALSDGSLTRLSALTPEELRSVPGVKQEKLASVLAAFELGRRFMAEDSCPDRRPVVSARSVFEQMLPYLKGLQREECWVLYLNNARLVTGRERLSVGGFSSTTIDCRSILRRALELRASALVLVHNHPSADPSPSKGDIAATRALQSAAGAFDIPLLDHVIISDDRFYSFKDERVFVR